MSAKIDGDCTICLRPLVEQPPLEKHPTTWAPVINLEKFPKKLPCGHVFHEGCIKEWIRIDPNCPLDGSSLRGSPTEISVEFLNGQREVVPLDGLSSDSAIHELIERVNRISSHQVRGLDKLLLCTPVGAVCSATEYIALLPNRTLLHYGIIAGSVTVLKESAFSYPSTDRDDVQDGKTLDDGEGSITRKFGGMFVEKEGPDHEGNAI